MPPSLVLRFVDGAGRTLGSARELGTHAAEWTEFGTSVAVPKGAVAAELTIPEIAQWATKAGWSSTSENPEQVVRTTIGTMLEAMRPRIELATPDQSGTRRYRLVGPRR